MNLIDTHCHLYSKEFEGDIEEVITRAAEVGVSDIFLPAIDSESHHQLIELTHKTSAQCRFLPLMGVHPCSINEKFEEQLSIAENYLNSDMKFYGIGETGLDYYWDVTYKEQQIIAFERQIQWSIDKSLPVIIHSRDSTEDCIKSVTKFNGKARGIFHCFTGDLAEANQIIELGFYLGIGGVLTYKNSTLRDVLRNVPLQSLVLETDAPYLPPVPYRGKRNEPSYTGLVCQALADVYGLSAEVVAETTAQNAYSVFKMNN